VEFFAELTTISTSTPWLSSGRLATKRETAGLALESRSKLHKHFEPRIVQPLIRVVQKRGR
jgi:hypothetical protein